jgi:hypothetical protein
MAVVSKKASSWAPIVISELAKQSVPLPLSLILSLIDVESNGFPGLVNKKSGAAGLMQVMPFVVDDFNKAHKGANYGPTDMRGKTDLDAKKQIRVGIWILSQFWKSANRYLSKRFSSVPVDELAKIADLFYVAGPGATRKRLDKLENPVFSNVEATFPKWNALPHPRRVFDRFQNSGEQFDLPAIQQWLSSGTPKIEIEPEEGAAIGIAVIAIAWWFIAAQKGVE